MTTLFRLSAVFVTVLAIAVLLRPAVSEYIAPLGKNLSQKALSLASKVTDEDASYHFRLASMYYGLHDQEALGLSVRHFRTAVTMNPGYGLGWFGLAKAYNDLGYDSLAEYSIKKSGLLDKSNRRIQWEAGMYFILEGKAEQAAPFFRRYMSLVPSEQGTVYTMFYTMGFSPGFILTNLVNKDYNSYRGYLDFLIANKRPDESADIWKWLAQWNRSRDDYMSYINFLITVGRTENAGALWEEYAKLFGLINGRESASEMMWNGGFELPIQNGGFDWRLGSGDGVRVFLDSDVKRSGHVSLSAQFFGTGNPDVYLAYQIVPVLPSQSYSLKGRIQTDSLTTTNGVFFEVSGYVCDSFTAKTRPIIGSSLWQDVELDFTTPPACKAVKVGIKRDKSEKFDNKISGDVWVDSISMTLAKKNAIEAR